MGKQCEHKIDVIHEMWRQAAFRHFDIHRFSATISNFFASDLSEFPATIFLRQTFSNFPDSKFLMHKKTHFKKIDFLFHLQNE